LGNPAITLPPKETLLANVLRPADANSTGTTSSADAEQIVRQTFSQLPLYFVENQGQLDKGVAYYIQGSDKTIYFAPDGVTFALTAPLTPTLSQREWKFNSHRSNLEEGPGERVSQRWTVKLDFVGANPNARPIGQDKTEAILSYFKGTPDQWKAGLPTYSRIVYPDLWPGIDLVYYGTVNQLKYEFIVQPGADPAQIRLAYHGVTGVDISAAGQLEVTTPIVSFHDDTPMAYQEINGQQVSVPIAYDLPESSELSGTWGFHVGDYDPAHPLILDPAVIVYCGYIGGSGRDYGSDIAVDSAGNAYITGWTQSTETTFPVSVGPDLTFNGGSIDAFVAKVNSAGTGLVYAGYIGGSGKEQSFGIAVDSVGHAYVAGYTDSTETTFPVIVGPDLTHNGGRDGFVAKINTTGTGLVYAGYIGGSSDDSASDIGVDNRGSVYIIGSTQSTQVTFPVAVGPDLTYNGGGDAFVAKVNATGSGLVYTGYIGGSALDDGIGIAVDSAGNAYVTGDTDSTEASFPVEVGPDLTHNGGTDIFVAKVNATGLGLVYAGYIGGSGTDWVNGIAVDGLGNVSITGQTDSTEATFPVTVGPDLTYNGGSADAFVAEVNAVGSSLVYAGYMGGSGYDRGYRIAVDNAGGTYVTGWTDSTEATFPVIGGPDLTYNGGSYDAFVAKVGTEHPINIPLASVVISGPMIGFTQTNLIFNATVSPITATTPITYVWQATGQSAVTHAGGGTGDSVNFTWVTTGTKAITVTAANALDAVTSGYAVDISPTRYQVYLPIVMKH
jgi:hypothetical protein